MKNIVILGSTGSIGINTLNVIKNHKDKFKIIGLSTNTNIELLKKQIQEFSPIAVCISSQKDACELQKDYKQINVFYGIEGLKILSSYPKADIIVIAVSGFIGIYPLIEAIKSEKYIALANKESLVIAGSIIKKLLDKYKSVIIPVDSEHSAIFQCLKNEDINKVKKIILTGSGGPFFRYKKSFKNIKVSDALKHPTWKMGRKITVDSATLMNKGLEIIEAHYLFDLPYEKIDLLIHPQSIIHSMVEFVDGVIIGLLSQPDMKISIQYALTYPLRLPSALKQLDLIKVSKLEFFKPDYKKFHCLRLAIESAKIGGTMPTVMNASNEETVNLFLKNKIKFDKIPIIIEKTMAKHKVIHNPILDDIFEVDRWTRQFVLDNYIFL